MALTDAGRDRLLGSDGYTGDSFFLSAHTGDPGAGDANEVTGGSYARLGVTFGAIQDRSGGGREVAVTSPGAFDIPSGNTVTHVVLRSTASGTGVVFDITDSTDLVFGSDGQANLTSYTIGV